MPESYTDFHLDFSGTSVWYHVLTGSKRFYFVKPTKENLEIYKYLEKADTKHEVFFSDVIRDDTYEIALEQGDTLLLPTGYIHAVYTPDRSLVFGGNFLSSFRADMQIQIYQMEEELKVVEKMKYPYFKLTHWLAIPKVRKELERDLEWLTKENCERDELHSHSRYKSYRSFVQYTLDYYNALKALNEKPRWDDAQSDDSEETEVEEEELDEWKTIGGYQNLELLQEMKQMLDRIGYEPPEEQELELSAKELVQRALAPTRQPDVEQVPSPKRKTKETKQAKTKQAKTSQANSPQARSPKSARTKSSEPKSPQTESLRAEPLESKSPSESPPTKSPPPESPQVQPSQEEVSFKVIIPVKREADKKQSPAKRIKPNPERADDSPKVKVKKEKPVHTSPPVNSESKVKIKSSSHSSVPHHLIHHSLYQNGSNNSFKSTLINGNGAHPKPPELPLNLFPILNAPKSAFKIPKKIFSQPAEHRVETKDQPSKDPPREPCELSEGNGPAFGEDWIDESAKVTNQPAKVPDQLTSGKVWTAKQPEATDRRTEEATDRRAAEAVDCSKKDVTDCSAKDATDRNAKVATNRNATVRCAMSVNYDVRFANGASLDVRRTKPANFGVRYAEETKQAKPEESTNGTTCEDRIDNPVDKTEQSKSERLACQQPSSQQAGPQQTEGDHQSATALPIKEPANNEVSASAFGEDWID